MAEEISKEDNGREIINGDDELLLEVSKHYAKYVENQMAFDAENGNVQDFQKIIEKIVGCCEENGWFK